MKKLLAFILLLTLIGSVALAELSSDMTEHTIGCFVFSLPSDWSEDGEVNDGSILTNGYYGEAPNGNRRVLTAIYTAAESRPESDSGLALLYKSIVNGMKAEDVNGEIIPVNGSDAYLWSGTWPLDTGDSVPIAGLVYIDGCDLLSFTYNHLDSSTEDLLEFIQSISSTIKTTTSDDGSESHMLSEIDLSGMSFEELITLRQQTDAALWASDSWQEIEVPAGVYVIGEDIPAGRYTLSFKGSSIAPVELFPGKDAYIENGFDTLVQEYLDPGESINLLLDDGQYLSLKGASNTYIFKPYTGAALGFK